MLKRFLTMLAMLFALLSITGCMEYEPENAATEESMASYHTDDTSQVRRYSSDPRINRLWFTSLDEFLYDYAAAREGRISPDLKTEIITEYIDFASLDTIHLLANVPEEFHIAEIRVHKTFITIWYIPIAEEVTWETWSDAFRNHQYFELMVTRWTYEDLESWGDNSPLNGIMGQFGFTEKDFIDGKYLFYESTRNLYWAQGSNRFRLTLPILAHENNDSSGLTAEELGPGTEINVRDMLKFTETVAVDLQNENNIAAWSAGDFSMFEELFTTTVELIGSYPVEDTSKHSENALDKMEINEPQEQAELCVFPVP
ncbi:MAG: hypothetical protein FWE27_01765 [Defluviitaleaceae bacterium]|nr:hypothetical protein [Defluviitaleaceae bacterium]